MNVAAKAESVYFSVKGQVVIPRRLRKEFEIEEGTRALRGVHAGGHPHQTRHHQVHPRPARIAQGQGRDEGDDGRSQGRTGTLIPLPLRLERGEGRGEVSNFDLN